MILYKLYFYMILLFSLSSLSYALDKSELTKECKKVLLVPEACEINQILYNFSRDKELMMSCVNVLGNNYILCKNSYLARKALTYPKELKVCVEISSNLKDSCGDEITLKVIRSNPKEYYRCIKDLKLYNADCIQSDVIKAIKKSFDEFYYCTKVLKKPIFYCKIPITLEVISKEKDVLENCLANYPDQRMWCWDYVNSKATACIMKFKQCTSLLFNPKVKTDYINESQRGETKSFDEEEKSLYLERTSTEVINR